MIDTASLYEVIEALDRQRPADNHVWAWQSAVEATCMIVFTENLRLAAGPTGEGAASGAYGLLRSRFDGQLAGAAPSARVAAAARTGTLRWARRNTLRIRQTKERLERQESFQRWLTWCIENAWVEKSARHRGLFDATFVPHISRILDIPVRDLERLRAASSVPDRLERLIASGARSAEFHATREAYVVSLLLRGRYHDSVARDSGWQIVHHPVRHAVLPAMRAPAGQSFALSMPETFLANIILASAFSQRRSVRLGSWAENVLAARRAYRTGALDAPLARHPRDPVASAVHAARTLHIRCHRETFDRTLDVAASVGFGYLSSVLLEGWESVAASALTASLAAFVLRRREPSKAVISQLSKRPGRLRQLALAGPGRVHRSWRSL
ncbi:hypothetical protein [Nonomuraea typhae]|uniref:hypothetical protein n=1 Tax=Nonomuraea typhae TaxID=2603600 RepID=UPI0012FC63EE|nr:hypothetical protein [Nonomuraea typhae]